MNTQTKQETEEEICCKCNADDDVHLCNGCNKYICIECDKGEMGTYSGDGSTYCYDCFPSEEEEEEDEEEE